jgi:hypothetical protein
MSCIVIPTTGFMSCIVIPTTGFMSCIVIPTTGFMSCIVIPTTGYMSGVLLPPDHRHELKFLIPITLLDMTTITVIDLPLRIKKKHFYFFPQNVKHP